MSETTDLMKSNLLSVLAEIQNQPEVGLNFPRDSQTYTEQIEQISEYLEYAHELGLAYESLVSMLESFPFQLSGKSSVRLLEVGLLMRFKTERPQDSLFDMRNL